MTNIHLESLKCFLVCLEELSYLNTPLSCTRTFREKAVVVVRKVALCFSIKMITNSISCLYYLDESDIFYIVYIVCIFASVPFSTKSFLLVDILSAILFVNITIGQIICN